jgi:hypothetical protein
MDIVKIQSLIAQGRLVELSDVDPTKSYLQLGIYQPGNRQKGASDFNTYAPFAIPLSELISGFKYEIGQYVPSEGGIIFHRWLSIAPLQAPQNGPVQNYLVLSPIGLVTEVYSNVTGIPNIGVTAQSKWDGLGNSNAIVSQVGHTTSAAQVCLNSTNGGKNDWYLPSLGEAYYIWNNIYDISRVVEALGSNLIKDQGSYWTSTEYSQPSGTLTTAFSYRFNGDRFDAVNKSNALNVIAVRKFSI